MISAPGLDPRRNLEKEVDRLARFALTAASSGLRAEGDALHGGIHGARKRFKRVRGLLRLVSAADKKACAAENGRLRIMARSLGTAREAAALVETLDRLLARFPGPARQSPLLRIRERLEARRDRITSAETDLPQKIGSVIAGCESSAEAFAALDLPRGRKKSAKLLSQGFTRNYARARKALAAARTEADIEAWHTLRKRIRDQWSHSIFLAEIWPSAFYARIAVLKTLIDLLGDDRDLIVLAHMADTEPGEIGKAADLAVLQDCIAAQSVELHAAIHRTAAGLLREKPDLVERRIRHLWLLAAEGK